MFLLLFLRTCGATHLGDRRLERSFRDSRCFGSLRCPHELRSSVGSCAASPARKEPDQSLNQPPMEIAFYTASLCYIIKIIPRTNAADRCCYFRLAHSYRRNLLPISNLPITSRLNSFISSSSGEPPISRPRDTVTPTSPRCARTRDAYPRSTQLPLKAVPFAARGDTNSSLSSVSFHSTCNGQAHAQARI